MSKLQLFLVALTVGCSCGQLALAQAALPSSLMFTLDSARAAFADARPATIEELQKGIWREIGWVNSENFNQSENTFDPSGRSDKRYLSFIKTSVRDAFGRPLIVVTQNYVASDGNVVSKPQTVLADAKVGITFRSQFFPNLAYSFNACKIVSQTGYLLCSRTVLSSNSSNIDDGIVSSFGLFQLIKN